MQRLDAAHVAVYVCEVLIVACINADQCVCATTAHV